MMVLTNATMRGFFRRQQTPILGITGLISLLVLWELTAQFKWMDPFFISRPTASLAALGQMIISGQVWRDLQSSLVELGIGYGLAVAIGVPLGLLAGWYRRLEYVIDPFVWFWYTVPHTALYPVLVAWFGLGGATIVVIVFLFAVATIYISTFSAMKGVDRGLIQAAHSFGASPFRIFRQVALPASVPLLLAGLRLGLGRALIGVVVGEIFGGMAGIGYRLHHSAARMRTAEFFAALFVLIILGLGTNLALRYVEHRFDRWRTN